MNIVKEILFPRRCPVCDGIVRLGTLVHRECERKLIKVHGPTCYKCGKELNDDTMEYCYDCSNRIHYFNEGTALYEYPSVRMSVYGLKYKARCEYAEYFGRQMALHFRDRIRKWKPDAIIPVPLHKRKQQIRGFNQAYLLAYYLAKNTQIPLLNNVVVRSRNTVPMKELDARQRQINLKKAFNIKQYDVKLKSIVIVDDIYTTGSTIDEIAYLLKNAGAERVYFITLAIGTGLGDI